MLAVVILRRVGCRAVYSFYTWTSRRVSLTGVTISDSVVEVTSDVVPLGDVDAVGGGAVAVTGGVGSLHVTLHACTFTNNSVVNLAVTPTLATFGVPSGGGGVYIVVGSKAFVNAGSTVSVSGTNCSANTVTLSSVAPPPPGMFYAGVGGQGGGAHITLVGGVVSNATVTVTNSTFTSGWSTGTGGLWIAVNSSTGGVLDSAVVVQGSRMRYNTGGGGGGGGGAVYISSPLSSIRNVVATVVDVVADFNTVTARGSGTCGGGLSVVGQAGADVHNVSVAVRSVRLVANAAGRGGGGHFHIGQLTCNAPMDGVTIAVDNATVQNNVAGGAWLVATVPHVLVFAFEHTHFQALIVFIDMF